MTRAIRTLLNCQSRCRLFPQKARLEKKRDERPRRAIRRGVTALRGWKGLAVQADRRIALFGSTIYVVMPKRHARPSSTMASAREEDSANPRGENTRRQFRRGDCNFSRPLSFSLLPAHFFPDTVFSHPWIIAHGRTILERSRFL